jgi:hypothetical protein
MILSRHASISSNSEDDIKAPAQFRSAASPSLSHTEIQESSAFGDPGYCAGGLLHAILGVYIEWFIVITGEAGLLEGLYLCKQLLGLIVVGKQTERIEVRFDQFVKLGRRHKFDSVVEKAEDELVSEPAKRYPEFVAINRSCHRYLPRAHRR